MGEEPEEEMDPWGNFQGPDSWEVNWGHTPVVNDSIERLGGIQSQLSLNLSAVSAQVLVSASTLQDVNYGLALLLH